MATFPASNKVPGNAGLTTDLDSVYGLLQNILGPVIPPSGDTTGATDPGNVNSAITTYGYAQLLGGLGPYYGNTTVTITENQWLHSHGDITWNLKTTSVPAFEMKQASAGSLLVNANGGHIGSPIKVVGSSGTVCPSDGSIGVRAGDVVRLYGNFHIFNCQNGLLLQNSNFWTEQATFRIVSTGNTNPVVMQQAASGGSTRTGSFDRLRLTVFHNETTSGAFGLGAVQMLAGAAIIGGGSITQYGNFGGTGQSGVYALYVNGTGPSPADSGSSRIQQGGILNHGLEYNGSGTAPGTIFLGSNAGQEIFASGNLGYGSHFAAGSISGPFNFTGPVFGDATLTSVAQTLTANGQTVGTANDTRAVRLAGASAFTGLIMSLGGWDGQLRAVINESASTQTFAAATGTSHVAVASFALTAGNGTQLLWDANTSLWVPV